MKKRILRIILIIILIIFVLFIGNITREFLIIKDLQNKIATYTNKTNYFMKETYDENDSLVTYQMYNKENKGKLIINRTIPNNNEIIIYFDNDNAIYTYKDTETNEIKKYDTEIPKREICNPYLLYTKENSSNSLVELLLTKIKSENYNNTDCYVISNSFSNYIYIDKETGLVLKEIENNSEIIYEYKFDFVSDEDVNMQ